jgi:hypothetical protein
MHVMNTPGDKDPPIVRRQRAALDLLIFEMLDRDPDRVVRALAMSLERLHAEGRYSTEEIEQGALQLCRELGIPRKVN